MNATAWSEAASQISQGRPGCFRQDGWSTVVASRPALSLGPPGLKASAASRRRRQLDVIVMKTRFALSLAPKPAARRLSGTKPTARLAVYGMEEEVTGGGESVVAKSHIVPHWPARIDRIISAKWKFKAGDIQCAQYRQRKVLMLISAC